MSKIKEIKKMFEDMHVDISEHSSENFLNDYLKQPKEQTFYSIKNNTKENKEEENAQLARHQRRIENCW